MNNGYTYRERIGPKGAGQRLDKYLSDRYRHSTLDQWRAHIAEGRVLLDGQAASADTPLGLKQRLEYHRPAWEEPDAPLGFPVLYDEGGVLVVHKPPGLPTMPGGGFLEHTLVHQLRLHYNGAPTHRLGRWTSGAVLCSRTTSAAAALTAQFKSRLVHKRYRALASGSPTQDHFDIDAPIGPVPYPPLGTLHAASPDGRPAHSTVTVIERRAQSSLCDVSIATGRPHQIRIHLAAVGHPLVGDPLYVAGGQPKPSGTALPGDPGYHLHSAEIGFLHPQTKQRVVVTAPPPDLLCVG